MADYSPTPHGVGGLKLDGVAGVAALGRSHPAWGGWIEILILSGIRILLLRPTPHGVGGLKSPL